MMNCCPHVTRLLGLFAVLLVVGGVLFMASERPAAAQAEEGKLLRHVVLFQFKESSTEEDVRKIVDAFRRLPSQIPQIADFEYGTDNSPEGLADGFTHCFLVSFKSEEDRKVYLPHKAHQEFVEVLKPHLEKVLVVDYWASK